MKNQVSRVTGIVYGFEVIITRTQCMRSRAWDMIGSWLA